MKRLGWTVAAFGMFLLSCLNLRWPKDFPFTRWQMAMSWRRNKIEGPIMRVYMKRKTF